MTEKINYICDIAYYLKSFERLGARYNLMNTYTDESLFSTLLMRCEWPAESKFIHPAYSSNKLYTDVWGIQFGNLALPGELKPDIPGKLTVCGVADGGNYYLVLDEQGYFYAVDHQDWGVTNLEEDAVMIDHLLIESNITRALIHIGYPKKPFGIEHVSMVEALQPVDDFDMVAKALALAEFRFSQGETAVALRLIIDVVSKFTYFPNLSGHERALVQRLLTAETMIIAPDATQLKNLLIQQLHNYQDMEFWLRDIFLNYILAVHPG
jgi:hypothetical protein